jgi:hypothetical protein
MPANHLRRRSLPAVRHQESTSSSGPGVLASVEPADQLCLRDGLTVVARAVTLDDEQAIWRFLTELSIDSRRLRFFTAAADLRAEARRGAAGDDADHHGVLAFAPGRGVVGHATYVRVTGSERAEVAVEVADDLHHLGLATLLMIRLARWAETHHIKRFFAEVLPENHDMLAVFDDAFATTTRRAADATEVEFPTSGWHAAHTRFDHQPASQQ